MRRPRVLLLTAPYHCGVLESAGRWPPLGLVYVGGALRAAGADVVIHDAMSRGDGLEEIGRVARDLQPDYIGIGAVTAAAPDALLALARAKAEAPAAVTMMGGVHATFSWREILAAPDCPVDYVVLGEGEATAAELVTCLESGGDPSRVAGLAFSRDGRAVVTPPRPFAPDLDRLPAAWDLLDWSLYTLFVVPGSRMAVTNTSRGCMHACSFCSQQKFWARSYRQRPAASVVDEIRRLKDERGVSIVMFSDEYPSADRRRWREILDRLIEADLGTDILLETRVEDIVRDAVWMEDYVRAGIRHIYVGVEATRQDALDRFNKGIRVEQSREAIRLINGAGMVSETSLVLGMPDETPDTVEATLALAREYGPDMAHFLLIAPWPYADLYRELLPYIETRDYRDYNLVTPVARSVAMSRDDLMKAVLDCYCRFYREKVPVWRALPEGYKRGYLLRAMRCMMEGSFLTKHLGSRGMMPDHHGAHPEPAGVAGPRAS